MIVAPNADGGATTIDKMDLAISVFGRSGAPKKKFKVVRVTIRSQHDITCTDIETICRAPHL